MKWVQFYGTWTLFGIAFFGIAMKFDLFSPVAIAEFINFLAYWMQHFNCIIFLYFKYLSWHSINSTCFVHGDAPKAHLTSHSRVSGSRWVTTISWLSQSLRLFGLVLCVLATFFKSLLLLLGPCCFCPLLYPSLPERVPWCLQSSWRDI